jgi:hypothetical protein
MGSISLPSGRAAVLEPALDLGHVSSAGDALQPWAASLFQRLSKVAADARAPAERWTDGGGDDDRVEALEVHRAPPPPCP